MLAFLAILWLASAPRHRTARLANLVIGVGYYGVRASRQYVVQMRQLLADRGRPADPARPAG